MTPIKIEEQDEYDHKSHFVIVLGKYPIKKGGNYRNNKSEDY